mgnify:CR=1 FL=1
MPNQPKAVIVEISRPLDVSLTVSASALRMNTTFIKFTRSQKVLRAAVRIEAIPDHKQRVGGKKCTETSPCEVKMQFLVAGSDKESFSSQKFYTTVFVYPSFKLQVSMRAEYVAMCVL